MGCGSSGAGTNRPRRPNQTIVFPNSSDEESQGEIVKLPPIDSRIKDVNMLIHGLASITLPANTNPVVSFHTESIPILLMRFVVNMENDVILYLPVIAMSRYKSGRILLFGSIDILSHDMIFKTETSAFLENTIIWGAANHHKTIRILLLSFPSSFIPSLINDLNSYGYLADSFNEIPPVTNYDIVFVPSYISSTVTHDFILNFLSKGSAVFFFSADIYGNPDSKYSSNDVLSIFGLSIAHSNLIPLSGNIEVNSFNTLESATFDSLCKQYLEFIRNNTQSTELIDDIVGKLKYYVVAIDATRVDDIMKIWDETWRYLERTHYYSNGDVCTTMIHGILSVLLTELTPRIPPHSIKKAPIASQFPGDCGIISFTERKMRINLHRNIVISTGLYLPPGVVGKIETDCNVIVHIGAHDENLLMKSNPWKRWPCVTSKFYIDTSFSEIASPFGGIVYVSSKENKNAQMSFSNFCRHPRYSVLKSSTWETSKSSEVPWGEIEMHGMTITIPTSFLLRIDRVELFVETLEKLVDDINTFFGIKNSKCKRIIFDYDLSQDEPICGEIIVLTVDSLNTIIDYRNPSPGLLTLLTLIGASAIGDNILDSEAEIALASVAACGALYSYWPDMDPLDCITGVPPAVFTDLWELYKNTNHSVFTLSFTACNTIRFEYGTSFIEKWDFFVKELKKNSGLELFSLDDRFKLVGKLSSVSSERLHDFKLEP